MLKLDDILSSLAFGADADGFEHALNKLAEVLGFAGQRPDDEWKEGPDNLWALTDGRYLLFECKNEVLEGRESINKHETGQMNNSIAWFKRHYVGAMLTSIMIIPTRKVNRAAGFNDSVSIMAKKDLEKLIGRVKSFFREFKGFRLDDISAAAVTAGLALHKLGVPELESSYSKAPIQE